MIQKGLFKQAVYLKGAGSVTAGRYAAGMMVDLVGIDLSPSSGLLELNYAEIKGWISGIEVCAELCGNSENRQIEIAENIEADYLLTDLLSVAELLIAKGKKVILDASVADDSLPHLCSEPINNQSILLLNDTKSPQPKCAVAFQLPRESAVGIADFNDLTEWLEAFED